MLNVLDTEVLGTGILEDVSGGGSSFLFAAKQMSTRTQDGQAHGRRGTVKGNY